jgi:acetyltransferase-like isoleucine patch superfamily enzyme
MMNFFDRVIRKMFSSPLGIPYSIISILICKVRSTYYSSKIDSGGGKIILTAPFIRFKIQKHNTSELFVKGDLKITPHVGGNNPVVIHMDVNSKLRINGDFLIGQGVRFFLGSNSTLTIGGKDKESASGITSDTLIMVSKNIEIGKDFLCAWNIFISDSDWHSIGGQSHQADVIIGDHVWVANSCSISKGAVICENCIVASHSKVTNKKFPKNSLLAGVPAQVVKNNISWCRDIS